MINFYGNEELAVWKDCHENGKPFFVLSKTDFDKPFFGIRQKEFRLQRDAIHYAKTFHPNVRLWKETNTDYVVINER